MRRTWHRIVTLAIPLATSLAAATIEEVVLDPRRVTDLAVSREVTTVMFPGPITALAGAEMLIEDGTASAEVEEGSPLRFHVTHAPGANFILVRSIQPDATGRLTAIYEGAAFVLNLQAVAAGSVASLIFVPRTAPVAVEVAGPPAPVKFSPRIGFSLLDRARAYPVLAQSLPKVVEGVTRRVQNRTVVLPDVEIVVEEVLRFSREDAVVLLLHVHNPTDQVVDLAPSSFAARVAHERFEQAIANGPRSLAPGESAHAEFAIVGLPDGSRNDLSADNAFTVLINTSRRPVEPVTLSADATTVEEEDQEPALEPEVLP